MKILLFPHSMEMGGSQLNAIELAAAVRNRGDHDVSVLAPQGVLVERIHDEGLACVPLASKVRSRPSTIAVRQLVRIVGEGGFDLIHGYEWPPILEAAAGARVAGVPAVGTVMSMALAPFLPKSLPIVVGTQTIAALAREDGFQSISVIEPPVDLEHNSINRAPRLSRDSLAVCRDSLLLVVVGRVVPELKLEGLLSACDAVSALNSRGEHVHLVIVGDGAGRPMLEVASSAANAAAGHQVVHMVGAVDDPRPFYALADVVLGMGGSAIRGLAFSKPLIVQGERGFWHTLTPQSAATFLGQGWYGLGPSADGRNEGAERLIKEVLSLANSSTRAELGRLGRQIAEEHFSLDRAAGVLEGIYLTARDARHGPTSCHLASSWIKATRHQQGRRLRSLWTQVPNDDFNAVAHRTQP